MRGLKYTTDVVHADEPQVALYTSAWIEIRKICIGHWNPDVALYTSAWIEMIGCKRTCR